MRTSDFPAPPVPLVACLPREWKRLCKHPESVRSDLAFAEDAIKVGDDMTLPFDELERVCHAALANGFGPSTSRDDTGPLGPWSWFWKPMKGSSSAPSALAVNDTVGGRWDVERRWFALFRFLSGGWTDEEVAIAWDEALADLTQIVWLPRDAHPQSCAAHFHLQCLCHAPYTAAQVDGLRCLYGYLMLFSMAVVMRSGSGIDASLWRLKALWRRVGHLLETGEDDINLAKVPKTRYGLE